MKTGTQSPLEVFVRVLCVFGLVLSTVSALTLTPVAQPIPVAQAAGNCPCSIWTTPPTPAETSIFIGYQQEVGVKFQSDTNGYLLGLRFYKATEDTSTTELGHLWSSTGTLLAEVFFHTGSATGWQTAYFDVPVPITANTTYIAAYYDTPGYFARTTNGLASAINNSPLHTLANAGIMSYGPPSSFPTISGSDNYWVDVVFNSTVPPDTTPPTVSSTSPASGAANVAPGTSLTAQFSEPLSAASVTSTSVQLLDATNAQVPGQVSYNGLIHQAVLVPYSTLKYSASYTFVIKGGANGVKDQAGNALVNNYNAAFTTGAFPAPLPGEGYGGPILIVANSGYPFSRYYTEILRAEGFNAYTLTDISNVTSALLANYDAVILGEMPLTSAQVTLFNNWVNNGANLIAMRPDKQLASLLGLSDASSVLPNAYLQVNTSVAPGTGIYSQTMQYHGVADLYTLNGATSVATLYTSAVTPTLNPAITMQSVGTSGGKAAAFTYDLARSIVYTRQGNPIWAGQDRDGEGVVRANDMFYGNSMNDPQSDWLDLSKVAVPQADEQQRLLANMILNMNLNKKPLPRFWYYPRGLKAVVVMTGDDHGGGGTSGRFDTYIANSPVGCSVANWECIRSTSYIYVSPNLSATQLAAYNSQGFEIAAHIDTDCSSYTPASAEAYFVEHLNIFSEAYPSLPAPTTNRTHCVVWSDWGTKFKVELNHGIRLNADYYSFSNPANLMAAVPGFFTGSGFPMRFADVDGTLFDDYQATTQINDDSGQDPMTWINALLDRALGPEGYYGVFTANMHTDVPPSGGSDFILAAAKARNVPVISARQMLQWLDARQASSFSNFAWNGSVLTFSLTQNANANGLQAMLPFNSANGSLVSVTRNGTAVPYSVLTIKGVAYAFFTGTSGSYSATYAIDTTPPTVSSVSPASNAISVPITSTVTAQFSESIDPATLTSSTFIVRDASSNPVQGALSYDALARQAALAPVVPLGYSARYTATLKGGSTGIKDIAGNPLVSDVVWSFTTEAAPVPQTCPCHIWTSPVTPAQPAISDGQPIEVGVKFRSDVNGYITGLRFYKGSGNTGTHTGHLWTSAGALLATATFVNETASDWQTVIFASPVPINANTTYVASYYSSGGYFAYNANYFTGNINNAPLHALASGVDGPNGVYVYGASAFPSAGSNANYWVDVVFETTAANDTTPPVVQSVSPASGVTDASPAGNIGVTFNEVLSATSVTTATFVLRDAANAIVPATVTYSIGSSTIVLAPSSPLVAGATYTATVLGGSNGVKDQAGNALVNNYTWSFTIATPQACPCNIWSSSVTPAQPAVSDGTAIEVGVKFRADSDGYITGLRFYKGSANTGTHVGHLWSSTGTLLATATYANETASGWQTVVFATPVAISANTTYVGSYYSPAGYFAYDPAYFTTGVDNAPLRALAAGVDGPNGVYLYGSAAFPTNGSNSNYWVDVVYSASVATDTTPPTVTNTSPINGATGVAAGTNVNATFSEALNATTVNTGTFELRDPANALVAAVVSYNGGTNTATLTPSGPLSPGVIYTATVKGGSVGVKDLAGNALASNYLFSFLTAVPQNCPCNIWPSNPVPGVDAISDGSPIEVGVKFRSDIGGYITGLRFYKGIANTGTHLGHLWSSTGTLLATATFANETASGWQTVTFDAPVAINANTTYVASYYSPLGFFALNSSYFAAGADNAPLHALASGIDGPNGVYFYNGSGFPTGGGNNNYWVDVIFQTSLVPPTVTGVSPINAATNVTVTTTITAAFSTALDAASVNTTTIQLSDPTNAVVPATVAYDLASHVATLQPNTALQANTIYTGRIKGGSGGVRAATGVPVAADYVWTFTTVAGQTCPCSIWNGLPSTPAYDAVTDNQPIEIGVKFRADVSGFVTGLRIYKGAADTGTHIGHLWASDGTLLATVNFVNETTSGWQEALLAAPVRINANTTYVVSYLSSAGYFALDGGYFTTGVDNPPLHAPASNVVGGNGVYLYTPTGGFPNQTYNAGNYWVDVVFRPNQPPVAAGDSVTTDEDTALNITAPGVLANDSDPDLDQLTALLIGSPAHGQLTLNSDGSFVYTPTLNFNGVDSFAYQASDGALTSNTASVTITVNPVNDPPVANSQSVTTNANSPVAITLSASDVDLDPLTYSIVASPAHGSLSGAAPNVTYTPSANYSGADSFTFKANDGQVDSNVATVSINVNAPVPTLTSISPSVGTAGGVTFTLVVTGTNFVSGSIVRWNGANRTTTFVSSTRLQASIPATDLAAAGTASVTVFNSTPGGGTSSALTFTINNPAPTISALGPSTAVAGDPALTLIVTGTSFVSGSIVRWNGANRTTTFVSSTRLTASILATDVLTAGTYSVTVFSPAPGGGTSSALTFTINNPAPTISAIGPSTSIAGSAAITLIVTGTNFVSGSIVRWNGANRTTTFVSSIRLTASVPATDLATAGTASVTVFNPTPGGGTSGTLTFTINNPVPTISALGPSTAVAGDPALTLIVTGTNFVSGSIVRWNGANRTTTFVNGTRLTASIPAIDLATAGNFNVTVFNPTPGGGTSSSLAFNVATNRLANPRFELDANADGLPDSWTSDSRFTRSSTAVHGGSFAGRHFAANNATYTIQQLVSGLSAGTTYQFTGWTNIPPTSDTFTYRLTIIWRNTGGNTLRTDVVKAYTATTGGSWDQATASLVAPTGTASALVNMEVTSLNATIYADDFTLRSVP